MTVYKIRRKDTHMYLKKYGWHEYGDLWHRYQDVRAKMRSLRKLSEGNAIWHNRLKDIVNHAEIVACTLEVVSKFDTTTNRWVSDE